MEEKTNDSKKKVKSRSKRTSKDKKEVHYHYYMGGDRPPRSEKEHENGNGGRAYYPPPPRDYHYHYYYEPPRPPSKTSSKPTIAGVLLVLTAILGLIAGVASIGFGFVIEDFDEGMDFFGEDTTGDITGVVTLEDGTPVEDVKISIIGEDKSTMTDDDGRYILKDVPTGNQKIKVEKDGYNNIIHKAFVGTDEFKSEDSGGEYQFDNEFDFTLKEGDDEVTEGSYPPWELFRTVMVVCGVLIIVFAIVTLVGAIHAFKRKNFKVAIAGAILGIFTIFGLIFAIIALFVLALSKDEFQKDDRGREY